MPEFLRTRTALISAALLLSGCTAAAKDGAAVLSEPIAPQNTAYTFEYACPRPLPAVRISGDSRWRDSGGYAARVTALSIGKAEANASVLTQINRRFPADALQERPWVTCMEGAARVEIRLVDRAKGGVSREAGPIFVIDENANVEFR